MNGGKIAALFVEANGVYFGLPNIEPWDKQKDARKYAGPYPVIAHPPCERWGRYWSGGPSGKVRKKKGDDNGCFDAAINAVRKFGGILEHPEASHAWAKYNIPRPCHLGGWIKDIYGGWTCCVEQGHYGHKARKKTWLYFVGPNPPPNLIWGTSGKRTAIEDGYHSKEERAEKHEQRKKYSLIGKRLSRKERIDTPIGFRDLLISLVSNP